MRGEAMRRICARLLQAGEDLSRLHALEFFAREGDWQTAVYFPMVKSLDAWEIAPDFRASLERNLPGAHVTIGDSFELALREENAGKFDFLVFDNPQGLYGPMGKYCEHFEALDLVPRLMANRAWVIFNVNWRPFNYDASPGWKRRRERYYGITRTDHLELDWLLQFYERKFEAAGLKVGRTFFEGRNEEYLSYFVFELERE